MVKVEPLTVEDVENLVKCQISVWESLRGLIPEKMLEDELKLCKDSTHAKRIKDSLERPDPYVPRILLIAKENDDVVGFATGYVAYGVCFLGLFGVKPEGRRRGIGSSLLSRFIEEAKLKGAHKVMLYTSPSLKPAITLYIKAGFIPEGFLRQHSYGMDLIIYSKFLI